MKLPTQIENQVNNFLKPKIKFNSSFNQYNYNENWLIDVTEESFKKECLIILNEINNHLAIGDNTKSFLEYLLIIIEKKLDFYKERKVINKFGYIQYKNINISPTDYSDEIQSKPERYNILDIINENESIIDLISREESYYYNLYRFKKEFNNYANQNDLEDVKLNFVLELHESFVLKLYQYISELLQDFENVNFDKFDFESLLISYELIENYSIKQKCHINLNKIDVANLFYFLLDEKLLLFTTSERQNAAIMKQFIEQNFTYKDDDGLQKNIANVNKEFSKVGYANDTSHKKFIDSLILMLETRKARLK